MLSFRAVRSRTCGEVASRNLLFRNDAQRCPLSEDAVRVSGLHRSRALVRCGNEPRRDSRSRLSGRAQPDGSNPNHPQKL